MGDWTKILVYGTFDGFTFSTDELTRINVVLDGGEIVEVPEDFVVSADQMVNKHKIKLKDVIARIEKLDLATKAVWINEILYKLGSNYGLHKYYEGYKQGKSNGAIEHEKVTIPQFVADYIKYTKEAEWDLLEAMDDVAYKDDKELRKWFNNNSENFALAWIFGYEVEKEKRYIVKVKNIGDGWEYLKWNSVQQYWYFGNKKRLDGVRLYHTLENLQKGGFGKVFVNPLFTIEEVAE